MRDAGPRCATLCMRSRCACYNYILHLCRTWHGAIKSHTHAEHAWPQAACFSACN